MSPAALAAPLPECALCEAPTRRDRWERNGGLCTSCSTGLTRAARMLPPVVPARRHAFHADGDSFVEVTD